MYEAASAQVMATLQAFPGSVVEVLGWDEAFVGIEVDDPEASARAIHDTVHAATGLHCSVGIGDTKVRAKIATDFGKPEGIYRLTRETWLDVMGGRPTSAVGCRAPDQRAAGRPRARDRRSARRRGRDGARRRIRPRTGPHVLALGRGEGSAVVDDTPWVARAHGHETTYQQDLVGPEAVAAAFRVLAEQVISDLRGEGRGCLRVHLKVRFAPFVTVVRVRKLAEATYNPAVVADTAMELYRRLEDDRPVRLLGVRGEVVAPEGGYGC